jgi:hypothetical protein
MRAVVRTREFVTTQGLPGNLFVIRAFPFAVEICFPIVCIGGTRLFRERIVENSPRAVHRGKPEISLFAF